MEKKLARIGFLINPIAGMGGAVGLKGTDGLVGQASARGAKPLAQERALACLNLLSSERERLLFFTASHEMGEWALCKSGLSFQLVHSAPTITGSIDTTEACRAFLKSNVDLILFCGGDGTARDVAGVAGRLPILGIPAGVKMHSGVFAISPQAASQLAVGYAKGELKARETEVVDVDEALYRKGELQTRLYAIASTPYQPILVQERKRIYVSGSEEEFKDQIALFAREFMRDGSAYILGAGTTTARIAELMGLEKTLLGVDVIKDGKLIERDASEKDLLKLIENERSIKILVSPIGAQGFILGRGSQQISPAVLKSVGIENLIIISTPHKLSELPRLLVDTGDETLDSQLSGRKMVVTGYRLAQRKDIIAASVRV